MVLRLSVVLLVCAWALAAAPASDAEADQPSAPASPPENRATSGNHVTLRDDQTILLNGKPFFPLGLYYANEEMADPSGKGLDGLKALGFNMFHYIGAGDQAVLDRLAARGLYLCWRPLGAFHEPEQSIAVVEQFRRHPAVLFWEHEDEPVMNNIPIEHSRRGVALLRKADPDHLLVCTQWPDPELPRSAYEPWAQIADISAFDWYPVPLKRWERRVAQFPPGWPYSIAVVGRLTERWRDWSGGKPVFVVIQAFSWEPEKWGKDGYPSLEQGRFMAYQAVIQGAKGLSIYGRLTHERPQPTTAPADSPEAAKAKAEFDKAQALNDWFWSYNRALIPELAAMGPVFAARDAAGPGPTIELTGDPGAAAAPGARAGPGMLTDASALEIRRKQVAGGIVTLLVNASDQPARLRLSEHAWAGKTIHVWHQARTIQADGRGRWEDRIEPFGVRVYADVSEAAVTH